MTTHEEGCSVTDLQQRIEELRSSIFHGNVTEGVTAFGTMLLETRDDAARASILIEMVLIFLLCGDLDEARHHWEEYCDIAVPNESTRGKAFLAFFMMIDDRHRRAVNRFEECLLEEPNCFEYYVLRALGYMQTRHLDHALADLERANAISPDNVLIMALMADVYTELKQLDKAMALHESVLEACPDFRRSLMNLGLIYLDKGRRQDAYRLFECLVAYDPVNWFAWNCIADILEATSGKTLRALPFYAAAIVSGSEVNLSWICLARGLYTENRFEQGYRVLVDFESRGLHWKKDEIETVRYMKLIGEVIEGSVTKDEVMSQLKRLRSFEFDFNHHLFTILHTLSHLRFEGDVTDIFVAELEVYMHVGEILISCERHYLQSEETLGLSAAIHLMIWSGMLMEVVTLLRMLGHIDEPQIQDMISLRWNEIYDHLEASRRAGIALEDFHEGILNAPNTHSYFSLIESSARDLIRAPREWRENLSAALHDDYCREFETILFDLPTDGIMTRLKKRFDDEVAKHNDHACDVYRRFWHAASVWSETNDVSTVENLSESERLTPEEMDIFRDFIAIAPVETERRPLSRAQVDSKQLEILWRAVRERERDIESDKLMAPADNDNFLQVCAAGLEEALSGFEPLPFTLDGTAFKRLMPKTIEARHILDESTLQDVLAAICRKILFVVTRRIQNEEIPSNAENDARVCRNVMQEIRILHGQEAFSDDPIHDDDNADVASVMSELCAHCSTYKVVAVRRDLRCFEPFRAFVSSPILSNKVAFKVQKIATTPNFAKFYDVPVVDNFLSYRDLYEQFFNGAVDAIESWRKTGNLDELSIFFDDAIYRFEPYQGKKRREKDAMPLLSPLKAGNSDSESNASHEIRNAAELADSLQKMYDQAKTISKMTLRSEIRFGEMNHPFSRQLRAWAQAHAQAIYGDIVEIEREFREYNLGNQFMLLWKIHDVLNRYPYLSRLYLILAGVHARIDEPEKAFLAVQAGLAWEDRLYGSIGWKPICANESGLERGFDPVEACTEFEETQSLLWSERFVFQPRDEAMYHYGDLDQLPSLRRRCHLENPRPWMRIIENDKSGGYDFYRLMRRFIVSQPSLKEAYLAALAAADLYSLRDYLVFTLKELVNPEQFPLRRQLAELLIGLYPLEDTGALARFYCDNLQPANALPLAALAYFSESQNGESTTQPAVTLGCLLYDMGFMDEAMIYLDQAMKVKNPSPMAYLTKGCALIEVREFDKAIECLKAGQKLDPTSDRFYYNMSLAYIEQGKLDEAEQAIKAGIELSAYPVDLNMQLMRVYVKRGLFENALALARYVAGEDPDLFSNALKYPEFDAFVQLKAVQQLLSECSFVQNP